MKYYLLLPLLLLLGQWSYAEALTAQDEEAGNSISLETSRDSLGGTALYTRLGLGLDRNNSLDLSYSSSSSADVTLNSYGLAWSRSMDKSWQSFSYQFSGEMDNVESHTLEAELGIKRGRWDASLLPRLHTMRIYTLIGKLDSVTLVTPGLGASFTYHTLNWDLGLEAGLNIYKKALDSYANSSRLFMVVDPLALDMVSGLEKQYTLARATRFQNWGEWGLEFLHSISAVDFSPARSLGANLLFYLGKSWDLRLAYADNHSQQGDSSSYTVGLTAYW